MPDYVVAKDGELMHYGVVGMKWGIRRAAKKDNNFRNSKSSYKAMKEELKIAKRMYKDSYKMAKEQAARDLYEKKGYDKTTVERISKMSAGKAVGQSILMGSYGALKYNESKGKGESTGRAAVKSILMNGVNVSTLGLASTIDGIDTRRTNKKKNANT